MDNNEINSVILKIYDEQKKTNKLIVGMQDQMVKMQDRIGRLENKYDGLQGQVIKLQEQVSKIQDSVNEIPEIKKELGALSGRVAVIEKEHGEKLQILLDVVTGNNEKSGELERRIKKDEKIINKHSDEIYYLQQKFRSA